MTRQAPRSLFRIAHIVRKTSWCVLSKSIDQLRYTEVRKSDQLLLRMCAIMVAETTELTPEEMKKFLSVHKGL